MKAFKIFSFFLVFCLAFASLSAGLAHPALEIGDVEQPDVVSSPLPTDQIIIKYFEATAPDFTGPMQADEMDRLSSAAGVEVAYLRPMSGDAHVLALSERMAEADVAAIAARLAALPGVEYAEPDAIMLPMVTPNDTNYSAQWDLLAPAGSNYGINAPAAWDIVTGTTGIVVAVIDTGITNHPDLAGRTVPGYDFITDVPTANDGNGRDADPSDPGDWVTSAEASLVGGPFYGCVVRNSTWHGTHVAGTIGAATNNSLGIAGINWNSKILPVRVMGKCGGYTSNIVDGMRWAAGLSVPDVAGNPTPAINPNPAKMLNLSLGGKGECTATYQEAINAISAAGATVVISAGNENANSVDYRPGNCNGVITVAATNRNGTRAYYSNYGTNVEISAPGGETTVLSNGILSTLNTGTQGPLAATYQYYQGTSMSAPHVVGVASLLYSLNPTIGPSRLLQVLQGTATQFPTGSTCTPASCGSGIVNAGNAVKPYIVSLLPNAVPKGISQASLAVSGANFSANSTIYVNGVAHLTTFVNSLTVSTVLTASELISKTTYAVTVASVRPSGIYTSTPATLTVGVFKTFLPVLAREYGWVNVISEDFESSFPAGLWNVTDKSMSGYTWAKRTCKAYQGSNSAWVLGGGTTGSGTACGASYIKNMKSWMTYGPFSLVGATAADVRAQLSLNVEAVLDRACIMASKDGVNFYGNCFWDSSGAWAEKSLDLTKVPTTPTLLNLLGETNVWVAIYFQSDTSTEHPEGAFVDNFVIRKCVATACSTSVSVMDQQSEPFEAILR